MPVTAFPARSVFGQRPSTRSLAFAFVYVAMVWLGRASRLDGSQVALVWPAAGVAVLWLTASWQQPRWRAADVVLLSALTFVGNALTGAPFPLALAFSAANVAQAIVTCIALAQLGSSRAGQQGLQGLARLIGAAVLGACAGAAVGPAVLALVGATDWPVDGPVWVFRNAVSTFLIVSAAAFLLAPDNDRPQPATSTARSILLLLVAAALNAMIFSGTTGAPLAFAVIPAGVYVGLRCSLRVATVHTLATWCVVGACTYLGRGPFLEHTADQRVMLVQALVAIVAFLTLALAIGRQEERALQSRLGEELGFVAALVDQLSTDLYICDERGQLHEFDSARQALVATREGLAPEDWPSAFGVRMPDGSRLLRADEIPLYRALHGERVEETPMLMPGADGEPHHLMVTAAPLFDGRGRQRGAVARARDVTELRAAEAQARQRAEDLETVAAVAHRLASETDLERARQAICDAVARSTGADVAFLFEPDAVRSQLDCTAAHGHVAGTFSVPLDGQASGTVKAFLSGRPFFVSETVDHPAVNQKLIALTGAASAVFYPVVNDGTTIAVLGVGWSEPVEVLPTRVSELLSLLAAEAAMAIDRARLIAELDSIARTDPLTGAHNRRALDARLGDDLARADRSNLPLCAVMIDLDHFKRYNDTHGHQQGDRLLKEAVARWMNEVRATDTLARYGGEEFSVVLPECSIVDAQRVAAKLSAVMPEGQTCSVGIAQSVPGESAESLLRRADAALYRAKAAGRDRIEIALPPESGSEETDANFSQMMLRAARQLLGMDLAFLAQVVDGHLVFRDLEGDMGGLELETGQAFDLDASYCQLVIDGRSDGRIPDTAADPHAAAVPITASGAVGAYIGAPIVLGDGRVVGTLCGMRSSPVQSLGEDQLELVRGLASSMAAFIARKAGPDPSETDLEDAWQQATASLTA